MDIGLFSDSFYPVVDGVGRVVVNYAETLAAMGERVHVISPMTDCGYRGGLPYDRVDFMASTMPFEKRYKTGVPITDPHYDVQLKMTKLDIIHAHSPFVAGQEALRVAHARNIPIVATFHSKYYDDFYKIAHIDMIAELGVKYVVSFFDKCDEVWTVSEYSAGTLREYGYKGEIVVMPNGTPEVTPDEAYKKEARAYFGLDDTPAFLYVGQVNWKKNLKTSLEAMRILARKGYAFRFVITGNGPDMEAVKKTAGELGIAERMIYTGHLTDDRLLYGLYMNATLFVFPSLYDTSGMVVREAAVMSTASVVAENSAPAECVTDGVNGFVTENTPEALAAKLQLVLDDPQLAVKLGIEAHRSISLPWPEVISAAAERYRALIEKHARKNAQD